MVKLEEPLTCEEEACLNRIQDQLHQMRKERLAFQECFQSELAKILKMLEKQNKILEAKIQERTTTTTIDSTRGSMEQETEPVMENKVEIKSLLENKKLMIIDVAAEENKDPEPSRLEISKFIQTPPRCLRSVLEE